jgi:hypothetical protein
MATSINIRISDHREPVRKRISIPQSDTGTQDWWDAQRDPATSIRLLILQEVSANGFVDRVNKFGTRPSSAPVAAAPAPAAPAVPPVPTVPAVPTVPVVPTVPAVAPVQAVPAVPPVPAARTIVSGAPVTPLDPRDSEIVELRIKIASYENAMSPFLTYNVDVHGAPVSV